MKYITITRAKHAVLYKRYDLNKGDFVDDKDADN